MLRYGFFLYAESFLDEFMDSRSSLQTTPVAPTQAIKDPHKSPDTQSLPVVVSSCKIFLIFVRCLK